MSTKKAPGVAPTTTEGQSRGSANCPPNEFPPIRRNTTIMTHQFTEGQTARILVGRYRASLGTVTTVDEGNVWVRPDGTDTPAPYTPEELAPVRRDDTVPATDEEVTEYLTGTVPTVDLYRCAEPGCQFILGATGPATVGEPDEYQTAIEAHVRSHEPDPEVGKARDVGMWVVAAGDVVVFRTTDGVMHADLLTDARIEEPAHLRDLARVLAVAADHWEAAL